MTIVAGGSRCSSGDLPSSFFFKFPVPCRSEQPATMTTAAAAAAAVVVVVVATTLFSSTLLPPLAFLFLVHAPLPNFMAHLFHVPSLHGGFSVIRYHAGREVSLEDRGGLCVHQERQTCGLERVSIGGTAS